MVPYLFQEQHTEVHHKMLEVHDHGRQQAACFVVVEFVEFVGFVGFVERERKKKKKKKEGGGGGGGVRE